MSHYSAKLQTQQLLTNSSHWFLSISSWTSISFWSCDKRLSILAKVHQSRRKKKFITLKFSQHNSESLLMHNNSMGEARLVATRNGSKRPNNEQEHWMTWHVTLHDNQHAQKKQITDTSQHNTEYGRRHRLTKHSTDSREVFTTWLIPLSLHSNMQYVWT